MASKSGEYNGTPNSLYILIAEHYLKPWNPEEADDEITFNVKLIGEQALQLYEADIVVEEGDTFSRAGKNVLVEYSDVRYDRICIIFRGGIHKKAGESVNGICNDIVPIIGEGYDYSTVMPAGSRKNEVVI